MATRPSSNRFARSRVRRWIAIAAFGIASGFVSSAAAQTDTQRAAARAAAQAGDKAYREGRYAEAADYFLRAENIMHAPTLLLHLARSYAKLGRYVEAREAYIKVIREVLDARAPDAFRKAQQSAKEELPDVEKRIARLTITVEGPSRESLQVTVGDKPVPAEIVGVPFPVDPGAHTVNATAPGFIPASKDVNLKEAESGSVRLTLQPDPNAGAVPVAPGPGSPPGGAGPVEPGPGPDPGVGGDGGRGLKIGAYSAFGVGAVGLGLGTVFLLQSSSDQDSADKRFRECDPGCSLEQQQEITKLDDDAASKKTLAVVTYAIGGVGVGAGVALLLLSNSGDSDSGRNVRPYFAGTSGGVVGRF